MKVIEIGVKNKITQRYFMEFRFYLQPVTRLDKHVSGSKIAEWSSFSILQQRK